MAKAEERVACMLAISFSNGGEGEAAVAVTEGFKCNLNRNLSPRSAAYFGFMSSWPNVKSIMAASLAASRERMCSRGRKKEKKCQYDKIVFF